MKAYQTKAPIIAGTSYSEVHKNAFAHFLRVKAVSKRKPYIRSVYFGKEKIFLQFFWEHLFQKSLPERVRRLKYFACALDLLMHSRMPPVTKVHPSKNHELLHRFCGMTKTGDIFFVQVKEDRRKGQKWLMSVFPLN